MGKSSKKVKNDRINMLRKQYDAFLEEDKKRRERNEYILGKLDKMRSASALVPISAQASYHLEANSLDVYMPTNNLRKNPDAYDNCVPYLERKHMDESTILKEISKKYIIIPKRATPIENSYAYRKDAINDNDWKSKYNILDDLKKQENGENSDNTLNPNNKIVMLTPEKDTESSINYNQTHNLENNSKQLDIATCDKNNELLKMDSLNTYKEGIKINENLNFEASRLNIHEDDVEKNPLQTASISSNEELKTKDAEFLSDKNLFDESVKHSINEAFPEKHDLDSSEKNELSTNPNPTQNIDTNFEINTENMSNNNNQMYFQESVDQSYYNQLPLESSDYVPHENVSDVSYCEQVVSNIKPQESGSSYSEQLLSDNMPQKHSAIELLDQNASNNSQNGNDASEITDITSTEKKEYDVKHSNLEGQLESHQTAYDSTEQYDTVQENIPMALENTEHTGHVDHDSEINAFEAEQKEMFYSEQAGGDTYTYNEGGDTIGEYTAEGYQQNDQYAYYEGVQQEQAYATNINEHEESTERYDPHYDQQYEASYENQHTDKTIYENTNAYDQEQFQEGSYENQQFENVVNYENPQDNANLYQQENNSNESEAQIAHDNQMYNQQFYTEEPDAQENIEQQLMTEEEAMQNTPMNVGELHKENEGESKTIMDVTYPAEHIPDPKLS